ncbi:MAG: GFA family protein [Prochloraceae cyanobacterium]|nr:GFA family protein [Prochloraceae cyanobacterium]
MNLSKQAITYEGGCHCGKIRFKAIVERQVATDCNCSICRKKGFLHLIVPEEKFTLLKGAEFLTTYTFNTGVAKHTFCRICGIHPFYRPRSHPEAIDVNLRCLDGDILSDFEIEFFDGINWEENVDRIRN